MTLDGQRGGIGFDTDTCRGGVDWNFDGRIGIEDSAFSMFFMDQALKAEEEERRRTGIDEENMRPRRGLLFRRTRNFANESSSIFGEQHCEGWDAANGSATRAEGPGRVNAPRDSFSSRHPRMVPIISKLIRVISAITIICSVIFTISQLSSLFL